MRIYLDTCCLNRPFDDQTQPRIRAESEAVRVIFARLNEQGWELVWSEAIDLEVSMTMDLALRYELNRFRGLATVHAVVDDISQRRANGLQIVGYGAYDALHIALAEASNANAFLTTDNKLHRKALSGAGAPRIVVANPLAWLILELRG